MRSNRESLSGFTLIEVLVVIAIMGLSMVLIAFSNPFGNTTLTDRAAVSSLMAGLRQARARAIVKQHPVALLIDVASKSFHIEKGAPSSNATMLPERLGITVLTAAGEIGGGTVAAIEFLPDGSSTGGAIQLIDGQWRNEITINWLTGRISADRDF